MNARNTLLAYETVKVFLRSKSLIPAYNCRGESDAPTGCNLPLLSLGLLITTNDTRFSLKTSDLTIT